MATVTIQPVPTALHRATDSRARHPGGVLLCAGLTCAAVLVHGYHPYAEDGGIYLTGIKYLLNRHLYAYDTGFVTSHLSFSCFANVVAGLVRLTSLDVMGVMFALYLVSILLTLLGAWRLCHSLFSPGQRQWAVCLLTAALSLPVAGTSLMLMDPYLSARSLTTPCLLFALAWAVQAVRERKHGFSGFGSMMLCGVASVCALLLHPLMGGYGIVLLLLFGAFAIQNSRLRTLALGAFGLAAVAVAVCLQGVGPAEPAGYAAIAQTRTYWFLSVWAWYEWLGLLLPLGIVAWFGFKNTGTTSAALLARAAFTAGVTGLLLALLFAHAHGRSFCVARLQPLRIFQMIYLLMILFLGASLGRLRSSTWIGSVICGVAACALFTSQRSIYSHSNHLEVPWVQPANGWQQGFLWIREHTPVDAVVALDSRYISAPGEDAQNFRAISERSAPPDFSKDGGIAAIRPQLTAEWYTGEPLQLSLDQLPDEQRRVRLASQGIHWLVLGHAAHTGLPCPFRNRSVSVCQIPPL